MLNRLRERVPGWLRAARWHAADFAWHANWRAIRAVTTPWARPSFEAARAKLFGGPAAPKGSVDGSVEAPPDPVTSLLYPPVTTHANAAATLHPNEPANRRSNEPANPPPGETDPRSPNEPAKRPPSETGRASPASRPPGEVVSEPVAAISGGPVIDRALLEGWLRDAAPPDVPFEAVVLETAGLRTRFGDGPTERRSLHMHGKLRMTHRGIPTRSVLVLALYSDVAADYFVESMAADVAGRVNERYGDGVAFADTQASVPVLLKEVATAAGLGKIGKNALFFSNRFGFNCKLNVVFLNAVVDRYDPLPTGQEWKLPDCTGCTLCVEACPVGAFDDFVITRTESCDRLIAGDFFGPRRDHMCRACITRCPVSNDVLKLRRSEGAPRRVFWDNEAQMSLVADLFMYRPSFLVWVLQRFYYGSELPGRDPDRKKGYTDSLSSAMNVTTSEKTRDGWRLAARRRR